MILAIDHIQFTVNDLKSASQFLKGYGYKTKFTEIDFLQADQKYFYFRDVNKSLSFQTLKDATSIELVNRQQGEKDNYPQILFPVFKGSLSGKECQLEDIDLSETVTQFFNDPIQIQFLKPLNAFCACIPNKASSDQQFSLQAVMIMASHLEASRDFWMNGLNFILNDSYSLTFPKNPISKPLQLLLIKSTKDLKQSKFIDDYGCSLISFLTTRIDEDRKRLCGFDRVDATDIYTYTINNKILKVCMIYGPSGEIVELIQIVKEINS